MLLRRCAYPLSDCTATPMGQKVKNTAILLSPCRNHEAEELGRSRSVAERPNRDHTMSVIIMHSRLYEPIALIAAAAVSDIITLKLSKLGDAVREPNLAAIAMIIIGM